MVYCPYVDIKQLGASTSRAEDRTEKAKLAQLSKQL